MSRLARIASFAIVSLLSTACSDSSHTTAVFQPIPTRLVVTASTTQLDPSHEVYSFDPRAVAAERVDAYYRLTTPAGMPLQFDVGTWTDGAQGLAMILLDHVMDGGVVPIGDPFSLTRAGLVVTGNGLTTDGEWISAMGDGLARFSVHGQIERPQRLVVRGEGTGVTLIDVVIGEASAINRPAPVEPETTGVLSRTTIYSSNSVQFGLPTIAVSGDRTSIVCYEGNRNWLDATRRYELRLQHDRLTGAITGGASVETSPDTGVWRDHEVVALYNVLGVVRSEATGVTMKLSFDRGATFNQDVQVLSGTSTSRLVQAAMASDYSLAIGAWRTRNDQSALEFVLVEAHPSAFDSSGSPTLFQFGAPQVLHSVSPSAIPLLTGITWSAGGDLIVGYGSNQFGFSRVRCAVRRYGEQIVDTQAAVERVFMLDPTVAVVGQGASLRVFCAYEGVLGITLLASSDGGATFPSRTVVGRPGDHMPTLFARESGGPTRVDLLYLAPRATGMELHHAFWSDWATSARVEQALTRASWQQVPTGGPPSLGMPATSYRATGIGWFGYDAALDGEQIVVVYDEVTMDAVWFMDLLLNQSLMVGAPASGLPPSYSPANPPPLAPGLTLPMPAPEAWHAHQLKLLRLQ